MSGGGEIRVLRQDQEPGQESPRMPAWKREILERRRAKGGAAGATGAGETSPSAESLGPLEENPFIKLEKERRRRQDRDNAARPVQHILELYGSVPGIRTIRAENIIIIDKSEENLKGQGRVSRMLQKFDSNYGKLQKKSHSTENLLDLDCSASSRPRSWSKPDVVPKPRFEPATPVFQSPGTSKPKAEPESPQRTPNHSVHSFRQRFEDGGSPSKDETDSRPSKPTREREWDSSADPKPKVPCSPETRRARAESSPSKTLRSTPDFEIRPSPKPDLSEIPDNDTQARALANLRLQSKNSFTVIPKRRLATSGSSAASPIPAGPVKSSPSHRVATGSATGVPTSPTSTATTNDLTKTTPLKSPLKSISNEISKTPTQIAHETSMTIPKSPPSPTKPVAKPVTIPATLPKTPPLKWDEQKQESLSQTPTSPPPVTSPPAFTSPPSSPLPAPSPLVHRRKGNTFTVVPKRKVETEPPSGSPESQTEALSEAPGGSTPPQAPYSQLGTLLKKRYPAVEEIEVIGGYLSLAKSCLVKTGSSGKKLKISFNESNLHSTYEYPSETSVWDSEDEDAERGDSPEETPSMVGRIHIPRAGLGLANNFISSLPLQLTPADSSSLSDFSSEPALYF
uniref:Uncharacterized protein n=1 Tax=Periophthalmus magnuspinnatus TaxID=409849 RepID=A0A3B4AIS7_9GOBI